MVWWRGHGRDRNQETSNVKCLNMIGCFVHICMLLNGAVFDVWCAQFYSHAFTDKGTHRTHICREREREI